MWKAILMYLQFSKYKHQANNLYKTAGSVAVVAWKLLVLRGCLEKTKFEILKKEEDVIGEMK